MCLQSLVKFHHCLFKIFRKKQNLADGQMDGRPDEHTDRQCENSIIKQTTWGLSRSRRWSKLKFFTQTTWWSKCKSFLKIGSNLKIVTRSEILIFVEVRRHQLETWSESDVIKFANHVIEFPCTGSSLGPRQANWVLIAYASSEGSGQPAHPCSLARTSAARSYKQWVKRNLQTEIPDPWPLSMAGHAQLKFVMTECSKTQIRLTGLN